MFNKIANYLKWEIINKLKGNNQKVVCIFLLNDKEEIIAQTAQKNSLIGTTDTQFVLPGGKVEHKFKETEQQAVHREMKEEANINVDIVKKLGKVRNNKYELCMYLCVPMDLSTMQVMEPGKQKELKFVSMDDKSIAWTPTNQIAVDKYKKQILDFARSSKYKEYQ
jgi:ADP-ribose pyrophosphatase YjhB (NUDIX family)